MSGKTSKIWSLPKGHVKRSDRSIYTAALRECHEETGIALNPAETPAMAIKINNIMYYIITINQAQTQQFTLVPCDKYEIGKVYVG